MLLGYGLGFLAKSLQRNHVDGIGVYSRELYSALLKQDIEIAPYLYGKYVFPKAYSIHSSFLQHVLEAQFFRKKITCQTKNFKPDLIHAPDHLIPRVNNIPVVATVMDLIPFIHPQWTRGKFRAVKNYLFKQTILSADHIITISEYSKQDLVNYFKLPEEKISVTYLGVNPAFFEPIDVVQKLQALQQLNLQPGFFLCVGTLQRRKNIEAALRAHELLSLEDRAKHPLVIVGNAGWASKELLINISKNEELGYVRWLKYLPDLTVRCLLQSAQALIYASLYEGFGLPILEAFASGCPVITANSTSLPEVAGDAAILVDPYDIDELNWQLQQVISDAKLRDNLVFKGLERVKSFSWDNCAKKTMEIYKLISG